MFQFWTQTHNAKDFSKEFEDLFGGNVEYSGTIELIDDHNVNETSAVKVLQEVEDQTNTRVVVIVANGEHICDILAIASKNVPSDTIWVGLSWVADEFPAPIGCDETRFPPDEYPLPKFPIGALIVLALVAVLLFGLWMYYFQRHGVVTRELQETLESIELIHSQTRPDTWSNSDEILVEVTPDGPDIDQYWDVIERLRDTMTDAHISKLWRIQNPGQFDYYSFQKQRLRNNNIDLNERRVWHGTSTLDPEEIYRDRNDGFMIQFSSDRGFWG
jgi:hypothetical protein